MKPCRHCQVRKANRPRGLCWRCYYTPGISALYPSTSKFARRAAVKDFYGATREPQPTDVPPGTPERVKVMEGRAARRESLFGGGDVEKRFDWRDETPPGHHGPAAGERGWWND